MKAVSTTLWNSIVTVKDTLVAPFKLDKTILPKIKKEPTLVYSRDREYLYVSPTFSPFGYVIITCLLVFLFVLFRSVLNNLIIHISVLIYPLIY